MRSNNLVNKLTLILATLTSLTMVILFEIPGAHHVLKETLFDEQGRLTEQTINSYVYDSDKYPVSGTSIHIPASGPQVTSRFTYFYK